MITVTQTLTHRLAQALNPLGGRLKNMDEASVTSLVGFSGELWKPGTLIIKLLRITLKNASKSQLMSEEVLC